MPQQLGEAKGTISLDASPVQATANKIKGYGQQIETSLSGVGNAANTANVSLGKLGKVVGAVGGLFGVQMGIGMVKQIGDLVVANNQMVTSYKRQEVAARSLAGSQANLNALLSTYHDVTKGVVDDATALADVTRMQAVGFADTTAELETFLTAAKGISVAMGRDQDYVIGQLQLSIANQSTMRLDQIGLGVTEVKNRIKELRAENRNLTKEMAYQEAVIGIAVEKYGKLTEASEASATGYERLTKAMKDNRLAAAQDMDDPINKIFSFFAGQIEMGGIQAEHGRRLRAERQRPALPGGTPGAADDVDDAGVFMQALREIFSPISQWIAENKVPTTQEELDRRWPADRDLYYTGYRDPDYKGKPSYTPPQGVGTAFPSADVSDHRALIASHYEQIQEIERNANTQRLQATQDFERQRTQIIQRYGLTLVREAEDFARGVSRASTEFNRSVADMRRDAGRREADARENLERGLADLREGHNERISEITNNYHRDMERSEADHKERLLGAAARLDAAGVVREQRRYAKERKDKEQNFKKTIKTQEESLQKQIDQREEAFERQLEIARRNDERRLEDMKRDFEYRQRIEQEDREIRLRRMQEDHQLQLDELQRNHDDKITQINQQEADEKIAREEKFKQELIVAGIAHEKWIDEQERWQDESLELFKAYWEGINDELERTTKRESDGSIRDIGDPSIEDEYADGGPVKRTGPAIVHAGEFVLNARTAGAMRGMIGNFSNRSIMESVGGRSINVAEGAINIQASEGMNLEALGQIVRSEMLAVLQVAN